VKFTVPEEEAPQYFVGRVEASDPDAGRNGRIFYYILRGNNGSWFSIDKTQGTLRTNKRLDREERDLYKLFVKASNDPSLVCEPSHCDIPETEDDHNDDSILEIDIDIQDINDNKLEFSASKYYVGVPYDSIVGDLVMDVMAFDPDTDNGPVSYNIKSSNLYRRGETQSAGSLVPSPFRMTEGGSRLLLDALMAEYNQQRFEINIEAREHTSGHIARATVFLWVYEPDQQIKLVVNKDPLSVKADKDDIVRELRNVTEDLVVIDTIRYHVSATDGLRRNMSDMYVHVVDPTTKQIKDPSTFVRAVDAKYDYLANYYKKVGIHMVVPAEVKSEEVVFDANLSALIALIGVLFIGIVTFAVVTCCLRYWFIDTNRPHKLAESPRPMKPGSVIDDGGLNGTDNPLWIDQKHKAYEEQELTMTVLSDQDNSVISGNGGSGNSRRGSMSGMETQSNAYATISKLPMAPSSRRSLFNGSLDISDYATLDKSSRSPLGPVVPGITSTPAGYGSAPAGYGSLPRRQYPPPPEYFSGGDGGGEPQIVGNLS